VLKLSKIKIYRKIREKTKKERISAISNHVMKERISPPFFLLSLSLVWGQEVGK